MLGPWHGACRIQHVCVQLAALPLKSAALATNQGCNPATHFAYMRVALADVCTFPVDWQHEAVGGEVQARRAAHAVRPRSAQRLRILLVQLVVRFQRNRTI